MHHPVPDSGRHALRGPAPEPADLPRGIPLDPPATPVQPPTVNRAQQLRRLGLRVTASRLGVLSVLEESPEALSGEQVYAALVKRRIDSSVGTVYRSIHEFEDRGVVCRVGAPGRKALYRIQQEGSSGPRLRFICSKCGCERELLDADLHERLLQAALEAGALLREQSLAITGMCEGRCALAR